MASKTESVSNHPVLLHKLTKLRSKDTTPNEFRQLLREITFYLGYEATMNLNTTEVKFESPVGSGVGAKIDETVALVPILRAGLGMVESMLDLVPYAKVHHIGMYRDKMSLVPIVYYNRLPARVACTVAIVLEPMIATAGSINACLSILKEWGVKRIKVIAVLASKEGLATLKREHPDVEVHVGAVDNKLLPNGYLDPGLGDIGDRLWGTTDDSAPDGKPAQPEAADPSASPPRGAGAGAGAASESARTKRQRA